MTRRMNLRALAYWMTVASLSVSIIWLFIDSYDHFASGDSRKALWRAISAALAAASLAMALLHPPD